MPHLDHRECGYHKFTSNTPSGMGVGSCFVPAYHCSKWPLALSQTKPSTVWPQLGDDQMASGTRQALFRPQQQRSTVGLGSAKSRQHSHQPNPVLSTATDQAHPPCLSLAELLLSVLALLPRPLHSSLLRSQLPKGCLLLQ